MRIRPALRCGLTLAVASGATSCRVHDSAPGERSAAATSEAPANAGDSQGRGRVVPPPRASVRGSGRTLTSDPEASVFGLTWLGDAWGVGLAYTDARDHVDLCRIGEKTVEGCAHSVKTPRYPDALVTSEDGGLPWVIYEAPGRGAQRSWRMMAARFDGATEVAMTMPDQGDVILESGPRFSWRSGSPPTGASVWHAGVGRETTAKERAEQERLHEEVAREQGMAIDFSPYVMTAHLPHAYGGGPTIHDGPRVAADGLARYGRIEVAVENEGWVAVAWLDRYETRAEDAPFTRHLLLQWFDAPTVPRASIEVPAPGGTVWGPVGIGADGTTYVVSDRSSPGASDPQVVVTSFGPDAGAHRERAVDVAGWVGDASTIARCQGRTWLVLNPYVGGNDRIDVVELRPEATLDPPTTIVTRRDPQAPAPDRQAFTRPGRVLHAACGPDGPAVAAQVGLHEGGSAFDGILLAQWTTR